MNHKKTVRRLVKQALEQGWKVTKTSSGHYRFIPPNPELPIVIVPSSPSDYHAWKNCLARLKRSGFHGALSMSFGQMVARWTRLRKEA